MKSIPKLNDINKTLTSLKKEDGTNLVTKEQTNELLSLKFSDGEPILTLEDRNFLYETVWLLNENGYDITYNFLSAGWEKVLGSYNIRKKMLFENPLLEKAKDKFNTDLNIYKTKVTVESGEKCRKCGSIETISISKQTRSCDEISTIKISCLNCKFRWTAQ